MSTTDQPQTLPDEDLPDLTVDAVMTLLDGFSSEELADMARRQSEVEEFAAALGPQTKEELWQWFKDRVGIELGRVAVCPGHVAQLDICWEIYSFAVKRVLLVLSRGGGKTSTMAWLDDCQAEHFPGWESFTIGPGYTQGQRKYEHLLPLVVEGGVIGGKEMPHVERSIQTETKWKNGSKMEIALGGTPEQANGPRVPRLHRDEVELMKDDTYKQAGNIPAGRQTRDGRYVPAQIVDTSTMKWAGGRVDTAIQEYQEALEKGIRPRQEVRISCIFEAAAENPTCRAVPQEVREARLRELGRDPCELCDCETYASDVWETDDPDKEPQPRTLESVCQGRFFRSRGYKAFDDIQTLFQENDRATWDSEQECSQPSKEGAFIKSYAQVLHGIRNYVPDPENGPIYNGVDWGGTDAHSTGWYQLLEREVVVEPYIGDKLKVLPVGALVRFDEIYKANIGNAALGKLVINKENEWIMRWPGWRVHERYPDPANAAGRLDWRDLLGLKTVSRIKKDFLEEVKYIRTRVGNILFFVDIPKCPMFDKAIRAWRAENGREVHDWTSHPMAEFRYVEHNLVVVARKAASLGQSVGDAPAAADDENRVREREVELVGATVKRNKPAPDEDDLGVAGAEDSPLRSEGRSMQSEDDWRAGFSFQGG